MRRSQTCITDTNAKFAQLDVALQHQIRLSSVRLTSGKFTGSGVLVIGSDNRAAILTAKHNLWICAEIDQPTGWTQSQVTELIGRFLSNLNVGYGPQNAQGNPTRNSVLTMTNSDVEFRTGWASWDYDLIAITFKDPQTIDPDSQDQISELPTYIRENPRHSVHYPQDPQLYRGNLAGREVFVTGFGDIQDSSGKQTSLSHPFQLRAARVAGHHVRVRRHETPNLDYENVLELTADNNSSTASGDSGGPVFCIHNKELYLLGVNLGSNYVPNAMPPDEPIANNAATFLFSNGQLF